MSLPPVRTRRLSPRESLREASRCCANIRADIEDYFRCVARKVLLHQPRPEELLLRHFFSPVPGRPGILFARWYGGPQAAGASPAKQLAEVCGSHYSVAMTIAETRNTNPKNLIAGATGDWEVIVGMEVHAQVTSKAKLFSGASTDFGGAPNTHVSLVDAAMPGMLPVINEECVKQAIRTGLGLKAKINLKLGLRAEELLLSRSAAGLSDLAIQAADRRRGRGVVDVGRTAGDSRMSRSASSGCISSRTPASRCTTSIRP